MPKLTRKGRIKKLDKIVSDIVRARDKVCVTCGRPDTLTCSHVFTRRHYATRWDLINCNTQCKTCNYRHNKDTYPYNQWFFMKYGILAFHDLRTRFWSKTNYKNHDLDKMFEQLKTYKQKTEASIIS